MSVIQSLGIMLGASWTSGINLYATILALGVGQRMEWLQLPEKLQVLSNPVIIAVALVFYMAEFFADKVPWVDSLWDTLHTLIRPLGGAVLAYMAVGDVNPVLQVLAVLTGGAVAASSHLTKATTRAAINVSPEPFSNWTASLSEDFLAISGIWLSLAHPALMAVLVVVFFLFSFWFIKKLSKYMARFFKNIKKLLNKRKEILTDNASDKPQGTQDAGK